MKASDRDKKDGTIGFGPAYAGRGKANHSHTTSFGDGLPDKETLPEPAKEVNTGQEEGARMRQPTSSIAGRILPEAKDSN